MTRPIVKKYRRLVKQTIRYITNELPNCVIIGLDDAPSNDTTIDFDRVRIHIRHTLHKCIISLVVIPHDTIENIKKTITRRFNNTLELTTECPICYDMIEKTDQVQCNKCGCYTCPECYINIFKNNDGFVKCYSCKNTVGVYHPPFMIDVAIENIRDNIEYYKKQNTLSNLRIAQAHLGETS